MLAADVVRLQQTARLPRRLRQSLHPLLSLRRERRTEGRRCRTTSARRGQIALQPICLGMAIGAAFRDNITIDRALAIAGGLRMDGWDVPSGQKSNWPGFFCIPGELSGGNNSITVIVESWARGM